MPCQLLADEILDAAVNMRQCHVHVTGTFFFALHEFYGKVYESLDGWYDRFAERARAEGEKAEPFSLQITVPRGDCTEAALDILESLRAALETTRSREDPTTAAMCDELAEALDKFLWMLKAAA
jgi:DNA-binding ferritin-like protein